MAGYTLVVSVLNNIKNYAVKNKSANYDNTVISITDANLSGLVSSTWLLIL
jgi:hypothetical protein